MLTLQKYLFILIAGILLVLSAIKGIGIVKNQIYYSSADQAADVLPVYLSTQAVVLGKDPTSKPALMETYDNLKMTAHAATFSTLYPATLPAILQPISGLSWPSFVKFWRWLLFFGVLSTGLLAGSQTKLKSWSIYLTPAIATFILVFFPATETCIRLGQVNMFLSFLIMLSMVAIGRNVPGVAGFAGALGASIKLVPAAVFWPILLSRRWIDLFVGGFFYIGFFLLAAFWVDTANIIENIQEALAFSNSIGPDWASKHSSPEKWVGFIAVFRASPMMWLTIVLIGITVLSKPNSKLAIAGIAMLSAWLGTSSSAFHVLYTPLFFPALVFAVSWPFEQKAPLKLSIPISILTIAASFGLWKFEIPGTVIEARMVLLGIIIWIFSVIRLFWEYSVAEFRIPSFLKPISHVIFPTAGLSIGIALVKSLPGQGPAGPPIPPLIQNPDAAGFIIDGERAPGIKSNNPRFVGQWPDVPVGNTLKPGTRQFLEEHLGQIPQLWDPIIKVSQDWESEILELKRIKPDSTANSSARELIEFLTFEGLLINKAKVEGIEIEQIENSWRLAIYGEKQRTKHKKRNLR